MYLYINDKNITNVVVICHGRNHRKIKEIDYGTTVFIDPDKKSGADFNLSLSDPIRKNIGKYQHLISAACPIMLELKSVVVNDNFIFIDGKINKTFIKNITLLLNVGGFFYTRPIYYAGKGIENNQLSIDKLYPYGFIFDQLTTFTFDDTKMAFLKFQYQGKPNKTKIINYLNTLVNRRNQFNHVPVKFIYYSYYSFSLYNEKIERLVVVNSDPFTFKFPNDYDDNETEGFIADDIIKLRCVLDDGTVINLL